MPTRRGWLYLTSGSSEALAVIANESILKGEYDQKGPLIITCLFIVKSS
jgi:hypothetical protein